MATRQPRVPGAEAPAPAAAPAPADTAIPKGAEGNPLTEADAFADLHDLPRPGDVPEGAPAIAEDEAYREQAKGLRAKDVDATRLRRSVLTLDGWVCPATSPAPKAKE
jgi:hypothetical protein